MQIGMNITQCPNIRFTINLEEESSRISARESGSSGAITRSSNGSPENFASSQPRSDHEP